MRVTKRIKNYNILRNRNIQRIPPRKSLPSCHQQSGESSSHVLRSPYPSIHPSIHSLPSPLDSENSQWRWTLLRCDASIKEKEGNERKKSRQIERERSKFDVSTFLPSFLPSFLPPFHVNPTSIFRSKVFRAAEKSAVEFRLRAIF